MNTVEKLIQDVSIARRKYIDQISKCKPVEAEWKPTPEVWSVTEITEHLYWAEHGGIFGMWKCICAIREGKLERKFETIHQNMPIERIIELTWQPKERVPAVAAPRLGGPLYFWTASLMSLQDLLESFGSSLNNDELRLTAHPHPISGPMDFQQRLEFMRFHLDRHRGQVSRLMDEMKR
jgi:hypothetical protein